jgi:hypothetical protein
MQWSAVVMGSSAGVCSKLQQSTNDRNWRVRGSEVEGSTTVAGVMSVDSS